MRLRKRFDLFAAVRPVRSLPGIHTPFENLEIVVIRENTEGLYSGLEHQVVPGVVESLKATTRAGGERVARFAFDYARERGRREVTLFHKANLMKLSDGLFMECARGLREEVAPEIEYEEMIIDAGCMRLVREPQPSPSRTARVSRSVGSEPATSGSVSAKQDRTRPSHSGRRWRSLCSSVPHFSIVCGLPSSGA